MRLRALAFVWPSPCAQAHRRNATKPGGSTLPVGTDHVMAVDHIRYDILAQEALRGVVRRVLVDAAESGLPGEHHFYISFDTCAEGVRLSPRMLAQYPEEITIVLQHQFWDLVVTENGFEVGLSFGGIPERLAVPFAAVKGFFDPAVRVRLAIRGDRGGCWRFPGGERCRGQGSRRTATAGGAQRCDAGDGSGAGAGKSGAREFRAGRDHARRGTRQARGQWRGRAARPLSQEVESGRQVGAAATSGAVGKSFVKLLRGRVYAMR